VTGGAGGSGRSPAEDTAARKREHLDLVLGGDVGFGRLEAGFDEVAVTPTALPERDLDEVDLAVEVLGARLRAPLLVSCMTGGVGEAGPVNRALAAAAQAHGIALGLGSGRIALDDDAALASFLVRDVAPDVLLLANLGAVQLRTRSTAEVARLVERCGADALVLHLNAVQEAVQPGGDTTFRGLLGLIGALVAALEVPVLAKEVGFGLSGADVVRLLDAGVTGIDVAGAGGTNWARVEGLRGDRAGAIAAAFADWGVPTVTAIVEARRAIDAAGSPAVLVASGGVRHGVDALKSLCLGADLVGLARGLLAAGAAGPDAAAAAVDVLVQQLRIGAWASGAGSVAELTPDRLRPTAGPGAAGPTRTS
jgi:isopentenyl-diphosphate Delta-isomerase